MKSSHPTGLHFHRAKRPDGLKDHGDCVTRAISLATGLSYQEVWAELYLLMQRFNHPGTPNGGVHTRIYSKYMQTKGWQYQSVPAKTHFHADNLPNVCIASQASHLVFVAQGSIWDTYDSRGKRRKKLEGFYYPLLNIGRHLTINEKFRPAEGINNSLDVMEI